MQLPKTESQKETEQMMEKAMRVLVLYDRMKDRATINERLAVDMNFGSYKSYRRFMSKAETCHKAAERIKRYFNNIISEIQL